MTLYPDGSSHGLIGAEAQQLHSDVVGERCAYPVFQGSVKHLVLGTGDGWEIYNLVCYTSLQDLVAMSTDLRRQGARPNMGAGFFKIV